MTRHWRVLLHRYAGLTVTLFLTTAPKLSGFALAMRLLVDGLPGLAADWQQMLAAVFSIIGAYYYLRIVKLMYFDDPEDISPIVCGQDTRLVLSFNGLAVLVLGLMPGALMTICMAAMRCGS